jgi:hypothetical protein
MKLRKVVHLLLMVPVVAAACAFAGSLYAQEMEGRALTAGLQRKQGQHSDLDRCALSGLVVDLQGRGIIGAPVSLSQEGIKRSVDVTTDATGRFNFPDLTPGRYKVVASAKGFQRLEQQTDITGGATSDLVLKLSVATVQSTVSVAVSRITF